MITPFKTPSSHVFLRFVHVVIFNWLLCVLWSCFKLNVFLFWCLLYRDIKSVQELTECIYPQAEIQYPQDECLLLNTLKMRVFTSEHTQEECLLLNTHSLCSWQQLSSVLLIWLSVVYGSEFVYWNTRFLHNKELMHNCILNRAICTS